MEIGKEESNVQNAQLSMQELYGKTQEPPHKNVLLTEICSIPTVSASMPTGYREWMESVR